MTIKLFNRRFLLKIGKLFEWGSQTTSGGHTSYGIILHLFEKILIEVTYIKRHRKSI